MMKAASEMSFTGNGLSSVVLGVLALALVVATLTGKKIPLISNEHVALIVLVVIGMAMCASGIGRVAASGQWTHPLTILGYLVGALILVVAISNLVGISVPLVSTTRQAILAVALLGAVKLLISAVHRFLF